MSFRNLIVTIITFGSFFLLSLMSGMSFSATDSNNDSLNINRSGTTSLATTPHALSPFLALKGDTPYVTWAEVDPNGVSRVYVRHQEGRKWVLDGGPLNQSLTGHAASPALAVVGDHLYAAWSETDARHVSQVYVKEWDGEKWIQVGGSLNINPAGSASSPVLSGADATLYVAWTEVNPSGTSLLYIKQWGGNSWTLLGEALNRDTKRHAMTPSLAAAKDGVYLAWAEYDAQGVAKVYVNHWDGERWGG